LPETLCEPAQGGDTADHRDSTGKHDLARVDVHQPRHRDSDQHIKYDIGRSNQEAQLLVGQVKINLDALCHHAEHLRIEEIQHGRKDDDGEPVIGGCARWPWHSVGLDVRHEPRRLRRCRCDDRGPPFPSESSLYVLLRI
jgi:hypothetical protein